MLRSRIAYYEFSVTIIYWKLKRSEGVLLFPLCIARTLLSWSCGCPGPWGMWLFVCFWRKGQNQSGRGPKRNPLLRSPQFWKVHVSGWREGGVEAAAGPPWWLVAFRGWGKRDGMQFLQACRGQAFPKAAPHRGLAARPGRLCWEALGRRFQGLAECPSP